MKKIVALMLMLSFVACSDMKSKRAMVKHPEPTKVSPEQMQQAFEKSSTPGPQQKILDPLVGRYTVETKMWMTPDAAPEVTQGTSEFNWIYGGRYLEQKFLGTFMGQQFEGRGTLAYDNVGGTYQSTWIDSMNTQIMTSEGTMDQTGKILTSEGTYSCPMKNGEVVSREVLTIGTDRHMFEMFSPGPDGKLVKMMEITYNRYTKPTKAMNITKKRKR